MNDVYSITGLIPIAEYARIHDLAPVSVRQKCIRGGYKTAVKIGRDWFIDPNEPHNDLRRKEFRDNSESKK